MHGTSYEQDSSSLPSVLAEYLERTDRGEVVCREDFLAAHPKHAAALEDYFASSDLIDRLMGDSLRSLPRNAEDIPHSFGEYDLLEEIGRGGMGVVYRARERSTGRLVALKLLLHSAFSSKADVRRFRNEARAAANLNHSGIIPIFYAGNQQGHLFYTMPLLEGGSLAQRLAEGPLDPKFAAQLLLTVAQAVAAAHQQGVIHRDLKPANILLDEHDHPSIADFGLARWLREDSEQFTATGDLLGTPNYMAPE